MGKLIEVIRVYGMYGGFLLFLYKLFYSKKHHLFYFNSFFKDFKSSLEILEWALKNGKIKRQGKMVYLLGLPNFPEKRFYFRPFCSDSQVLRQHFFYQELSPIVSYFIKKGISPKMIIDAGGNIGASACYLHWIFPQMKSLLLEPSKLNLDMAKRNLEYENSILWQKAIWWKEDKIKFDDSKSPWAMNITNSDKGKNVEGISLSKILSFPEFINVDYIKIDIEGAEEFVFTKDLELKDRVKNVSCISVEPHSESGKRILELHLKSWGFRVENHGELVIGFR